mmetsp:Transcript_8056/g.15772  ORF Transcript_8056/g.15772 Transcript_8056/m.15772 type:complete len:106 (+) Transcript_8056:414-731(+)
MAGSHQRPAADYHHTILILKPFNNIVASTCDTSSHPEDARRKNCTNRQHPLDPELKMSERNEAVTSFVKCNTLITQHARRGNASKSCAIVSSWHNVTMWLAYEVA